MSIVNPTHPGGSVRDSMNAMGWTVEECADNLGISRDTLSHLVNGKCGISPAVAIALENVGWSNAKFWMRRQAYYDLALERLKLAAAKQTDPIAPILDPGRNPICSDIEDASVNHDKYIYADNVEK